MNGPQPSKLLSAATMLALTAALALPARETHALSSLVPGSEAIGPVASSLGGSATTSQARYRIFTRAKKFSKRHAKKKRQLALARAIAAPTRGSQPLRLIDPPRLLVPPLPRKSNSQQGSPDLNKSKPADEVLTIPAGKSDDVVRLGIKLKLPAGDEKIFLRARGLPIQEVLAAISEIRSLNIVIDPSVSGVVAVDFLDVPLNSVLETLLATNALTMVKMGSAYVIYRSGRFGQALIKFIPVHFTQASILVGQITTIIGTSGLSGASNQGGAGGAGGAAAPAGGGAAPASGGAAAAAPAGPGFSPEFRLISNARINSLIVHGTLEDIELVEKLARRLDVLMPSKIFRLTHLTPTEAINLLRSSYFVGAGQGTDVTVSGGGAGAGAGGGGAGGAGGGAAGAGGAGGGGAGGPGGASFQETDFGANTGMTQASALRTQSITTTEATPRFVPLGRENNLLVIGSKEELALVEQILPRIDKKRRQVLLRTQIVELSEDGQKSLGVIIEQINPNGGLVNFSTGGGGSLSGGNVRVDIAGPSLAANIRAAISALVSKSQAKILASPALLAMDNRHSRIIATEEILSGVTTQTTAVGQSAQVTQTAQFSPVGITLEVTPRILLDNSVNLFVHPQVSFPGTAVNFGGNTITRPRNREYQSQEVRVRDGETIVIGGLIQERQDESSQKVPLLGDIPLLGALFSRTTVNTVRSEVQIYITPEIQPDA